MLGRREQRVHPERDAANKALAMLGPMPMISDWEGPWALKRFAELYEMLQDRQAADDRIALASTQRPKAIEG